jgi:hypothetical protein
MAQVDTSVSKDRSSGKEIEIEIGSVVFTAKLLDDKAPKTCKAILSILPYEDITYHQFWSGNGIQVHSPTLKKMAEDYGLWPTANFPDYRENPSIFGCPGDVGFYPVGNGIFITYGKARFYGPPEGVEPTYIFAEITEDLVKLSEVGRNIGRHGQQTIKIREKK